MTFIGYFTPTGEQIVGLLAVLATFVMFASIGGFVAGSKRFVAADAFVGWGVVNVVVTIFGVFGHIPFTWLFSVIWLAAIPAAYLSWRRDRREEVNGCATGIIWRIMVLSLPLIIAATAMRASQWDEFSQWLPNAQYIFRYDAFPRLDLPKSPSSFAAYPYALPLINYFSSKLAGGFIENAGSLGNLMLLLLFAPIFIDMTRRGLKTEPAWGKTWGAAALGILGVTVLSTTFVQKIALTAYADSTTAVSLAVLAVLGWKMLEGLAENNPNTRLKVKTLAWQFAWVAAVFLNIKQPNLVLLVILVSAMALVALRDDKIGVLRFIRFLPLLLGPAAVIYLSWRYHVQINMPRGEFSVPPYDRWLVSDAFTILQRMLLIASKKGAYFLMMLVISGLALRALWRPRGGFDRLAILAGGVFLGYNLFLWIMYIAVFGPGEGMRAASYWRYNVQLGLLGATTAAYGLAVLWRVHVVPRLKTGSALPGVLAALAVVAVVVGPLAARKKLRFDIRPQKDHMRMVGRELAKILPANSRLAIIDPGGVGFTDLVIRYELTSAGGAGKRLSTTYQFNVIGMSPGSLGRKVEKDGITYAWINKTTDKVEAAMGMKLARRSSHYLRYAGGGRWELLRSWPYDGYDDPHSLPD